MLSMLLSHGLYGIPYIICTLFCTVQHTPNKSLQVTFEILDTATTAEVMDAPGFTLHELKGSEKDRRST